MAVFMEKKMTTIMLFVCALICLVPTGAIANGMDPCQDSDLQISTARTHRESKIIGGQREYLVTIHNQCSCTVSGVVLYCLDGLSSTEPVNKNMIHIVDNKSKLCLVYNGWPIFKGSQVTFTYAWKTPLGFLRVHDGDWRLEAAQPTDWPRWSTHDGSGRHSFPHPLVYNQGDANDDH